MHIYYIYMHIYVCMYKFQTKYMYKNINNAKVVFLPNLPRWSFGRFEDLKVWKKLKYNF